MTRAALVKLGCEVVVAGNGFEALGHWQPRRFDIVLMDCHMPGMDGHLSKPFELDALAGIVARWVPEPRADTSDDDTGYA